MTTPNEELRARLLATEIVRAFEVKLRVWGDKLPNSAVSDFMATVTWANAALARQEAGPNDDDAEGFDAVLRHGFFIQEVDFGDEGKGYFVRMRDFNTIAARLDECLARQEEGREAGPEHSPEAWRLTAKAVDVSVLATVPLDAVLALVAKWRKDADFYRMPDLRHCADELESLTRGGK